MNKIKIQFIFLCLLMMAFAVKNQAQNATGSSIASRTKLQASGTKAIEQRVYDNGLGDIVQEIQTYPGSSLSSVVVQHEYDDYRRKTKTWLPVSVTSSSGSGFVCNISSLANTRYGDSKAFSLTEYDDFLQSQPSAQYKAGTKWQNGKKKVSVTYSDTTMMGMYIYFDDTYLTIRAEDATYFRTKTVDEDGCTSVEYTDVNNRRLISETSQGMTYYVYNVKGDISYVIPPMLSKQILSNYEEFKKKRKYRNLEMEIHETYDSIQMYAYVYHYDYKRHCIYKKLPGCDPIFYVYDKAGNCILSQDGNQRQKGEWLYTIPDKLGRPCISGICKNPQKSLDTIYVYAEYNGKSASTGGYEINGLNYNSQELYSATYYDNYDFIGKHGVPTSLSKSAYSGFSIDASLGRGLKTGSATAIISATSKLNKDSVAGYTYSAIYYDSRYNVTQVKTKNHRGNIEITSTSYSYTGKPLTVEIRRDIRAAGDFERYKYSYDSADRLKDITHTMSASGANSRTILRNSYNALGQLTYQYKGNDSKLTTTYSYDMHSWLTNISTSYQSNLFQEKLMYADSDKPCYNGNISAMKWKAGANDSQKTYKFQYDDASQLLSATYSENGNSKINYSTNYTYDSMGNITSLKRKGKLDDGTYGYVDQLTMSYNGNHLVKVDNSEPDPTYKNAWYFHDGAKCSTEYEYDRNGNVWRDYNKAKWISKIVYNSLNLPVVIKLSQGNTIIYTYSADGRKLSAEYITSSPASTKKVDYCGNMIYENGKPKHLLFEGGYIPLDDMSMTYRYYVKDHLGNNRMVVHEAGMVEQVNHYYPYGGLMANSTGWNAQNFKYNGKELDRMHGLDWYDYGARWMDGVVGRWHSMDPLCEKYYSTSPYAYCRNNPVKFIDPDGRKIEIYKYSTPEFKEKYEKARAYLIEKGCGDILKKLEDAPNVFIIKEAKNDDSHFNCKTNVIWWDPYSVTVTNEDKRLSPATTLNHEADHALQKLEMKDFDEKSQKGSDPEYDTVCDRLTIQGAEQRTALALGEIQEGEVTRKDHKAKEFGYTDDPTKTK